MLRVKINYSDWHKRLVKIYGKIPSFSSSGYALPPLVVQIEVTHRCNLDCSTCYQKKGSKREEELTFEEIRGIIDQLPRATFLTLTGGEPFIREDMPEIINYALSRSRCNILTNGTLIGEDTIRMFVEKGLFLFGISIDGIGSIHDKIRSGKGVYEKAVAVISSIQKYKEGMRKKYPLIDINTLILPQNTECLFDILLFAEKMEADYLTIILPKLSDAQYTPPFYDELNHEKFLSFPRGPEFLDIIDQSILSKQINLIKSHQGPVRIRSYPYDILERGGIQKYLKRQLKLQDFYPCYVPWSTVCISNQGDVYPCLAYRVGTIRENSLKDIWNGQHFREFRKKLREVNLLPGCLGCCYSKFKKDSGLQ
jgi:MoaA/NifB/PqqE/SkfB family radical SAM enzyme